MFWHFFGTVLGKSNRSRIVSLSSVFVCFHVLGSSDFEYISASVSQARLWRNSLAFTLATGYPSKSIKVLSLSWSYIDWSALEASFTCILCSYRQDDQGTHTQARNSMHVSFLLCQDRHLCCLCLSQLRGLSNADLSMPGFALFIWIGSDHQCRDL